MAFTLSVQHENQDAKLKTQNIKLEKVADPEWGVFVGFMLVPALGFLIFGDFRRAEFFAGTAIYLGVLKWLGWLLFTRSSTRFPSFLFFPVELFVGLAALCFWFYLRNALGWLWPGSYGLGELKALPFLAVGIHLIAGISKVGSLRAALARDRYYWRRWLGERVLIYLPFAFLLTIALWIVSGLLYVQSSDPTHHAFSARIYRYEGLFFRRVSGEFLLQYPSGFGAINAVTLAVSPLNAVQAVNLQHILWVVAGFFLVTSSIAILTQRTLWLLHCTPLLFLSVFPLHALFPYLNYEGTARLAAPAFLIAICLLPVLTSVRGIVACRVLIGTEILLGILTVALNPACAPFAALAMLLATVIFCYKEKNLLGIGYVRSLGFQGLLVLAFSVLIFGCDRYYSLMLNNFATSRVLAHPTDKTRPLVVSERSAFSWQAGLKAVVSENPLFFTSEKNKLVAFLYPGLPQFHDWQQKYPFVVFPPLALTLGLIVLAYFVRSRRRKEQAGLAGQLPLILAVCFGLWIVVKYASAFLAGGFSWDSPDTALLSSYITVLASRCELVLVFVILAAGASYLFLLAEVYLRGRAEWQPITLAMSMPLYCFALICVLWSACASGHLHAQGFPISGQVMKKHFVLSRYVSTQNFPTTGCLMAQSFQQVLEGPITEDDRKLVAWLDANLPPAKGLIGLTARLRAIGQNAREKHIYPIAGAQAPLYYSKGYNFCFTMTDPNLRTPYKDYRAHVRDRLDVDWCLLNNIRYFYVPEGYLEDNPGIKKAIRDGHLRPVQGGRFGASAIYEVARDERQ